MLKRTIHMIADSIKRRLFVDKSPTGCNMHGRDKWIREKLSKLPAGSKLLDAGAGECYYKPDCAHLEYIAQDFCEYKGSPSWDGVVYAWDTSQIDIVSDICKIPLEDGSVDAVLCSEVIEHVPDPVAALKEIMRIVRPGGYLIVTAPFMSSSHQVPYHFATGFNRYFYETHIGKQNFDILELTANGNLFKYFTQEVALYRYYAKKIYSTKYSLHFLLDIVASAIMLWRLGVGNRVANRKGIDCTEDVCFSYHVLAQKKTAAETA